MTCRSTRHAVARHLAVLDRAGLVEPPRQHRREVRSAVRPERLDAATQWLTRRSSHSRRPRRRETEIAAVTKVEEYRNELRGLQAWEPFLLGHSGLPGPRANLALVHAAGEEADEGRARQLTAADEEFLVMCGAVALGRLVAEGRSDLARRLRKLASDPRWRVREAVAMALQRWGDEDFDAMAAEAERWAEGPPLEQRAAVAAVCEPRLLRAAEAARRALDLLECVTASLPRSRDRVLRQALGYCWSIAVAALPQDGFQRFAALERSDDPDIQWVVRENLKKARLARLRGARPSTTA